MAESHYLVIILLDINLPLAGTDEVSGGCYGFVLITYCTCYCWRSLNTCIQHCCSSNCSSILCSCFLFSSVWVSTFLMLAHWLLLCCWIWNIHNVITSGWSSLNSFWVDSNRTYWEFLSPYASILRMLSTYKEQTGSRLRWSFNRSTIGCIFTPTRQGRPIWSTFKCIFGFPCV